jgi:hypothetical protein
MTTKKHCQNCMVECEWNIIEAPDGKEYGVCDSCVSAVKEGKARCVLHGST